MFMTKTYSRIDNLKEDLRFYTDMYLNLQKAMTPNDTYSFEMIVTPEFQKAVSEYFGLRLEQVLKELMQLDSFEK